MTFATKLFLRIFAHGVALAVTLVLSAAASDAQTGDNAPRARNKIPSEISLAELPTPPPTIQRLIDRGNVRLITGGEPQTSSTRFPGGGQLAGETRFKFRYRYHSNARWRVIDRPLASAGSAPGTKSVRIAMNLRNVRLMQTHEVWLRSPPDSDDFWETPIVQHEFDHVAISSHPKIEQMFRDRLKRLRSFTVPLDAVEDQRGRVDRARVGALIDQKMQEELKATTDFVGVRYRELDYQTRHGIRPLPPDWQPIPITRGADSGRAE